MKIHRGPISIVLPVLILTLAQSQEDSRDRNAISAIYTNGTLRVSIPHEAARAGAGRLTVEVLEPEDHVIGRAERRAEIGSAAGHWRSEVPLPRSLPTDDLVWHRLRYQFTYDRDTAPAVHGIHSISQILRQPVVHVLGQQSYPSGGTAAVRLIVSDSQRDTAVDSGTVQILLVGPGEEKHFLFSGKLNQRGTTQAQFRFPTLPAGRYSMHYAVETPIGSASYTQEVQLEEKVSILLTTEKPIYQPSQTIHTRALALDRATHEAAANRKLTFEVDDSRGNKVFRKITQTDTYGIASAEFALADEVNLGTYHLRALLDDAEARRNTSEIALQVERYVLPKFKVAVDLAGRDTKAKRGYRPGDHVTGTVRANYLFGKPVESAEVSVKANGMDVSVFEAGTAQGKADSDGAYRFDLTLPNYFAGRSQNHGAARVLIEATVKDRAGHSESRGEPITVTDSPLLITAIPESGALVPGLDNQVFVLTSYPDGSPARADIRVRTSGHPDHFATTDATGVAIVPMRADGDATFRVEARDREGNRASASIPLQSRPGPDQVLLRTEQAVYRAGETIHLQVFSTRHGGSIYVDAIKEGRTVVTRDLDLLNGRAELSLPATPELAGAVEFNAYLIGSNGLPLGDHRLVFVQPSDELKVETSLDAPVYKPGSEARIGFRVTNTKGEGVQAALGLQVVDQAVFALAEKQPGFAKVFFYLEQELMKPHYEIHSLSLPDAITSTDLAARALFSATEMVAARKADFEFGRTISQARFGAYAARYANQLREQVSRLSDLLAAAPPRGQETCNPERVATRLRKGHSTDILDGWGHELHLEHGSGSLQVRSSGPDGEPFTSDDLLQPLPNSGCMAWQPDYSGNGRMRIEHGNVDGLAEVIGGAIDASGAAVPDAFVDLIDIDTGKREKTKTAANGAFTFSGIRPGRYRLRVESRGFKTEVRDFSLKAGDRAVLTALLQVGQVTETIEVTAEAPLLAMNASRSATFAMSARTDLPMNGRAVRAPSSKPAAAETHVRSWFPEALFIAPEIITDRQGRASITIPIADNITTWRMATLASTPHGALGSGASSLKVFQDFFVDLDLPVTLTQGDQVSIPVAVYNYSGAPGSVALQLQEDDWFSATADSLNKDVSVASDRVAGSQFTIEARRIGKFKLTLHARMDGASKRADIVVREIEVVPNGREQSAVFNGRLDSAVRHRVDFPAGSIPDARTIFVRLYPGPMSQVVEGMDSLLRMPYGCFEQTSSSTYPNVLALDYMKRTKKLTPEIHAKAEGFIATGYQRLLTFEVPGGGFSWFGQAPANKILTSYGLMEFSDMSKVHDMDPRVIRRTQDWLARQQQPDGSWRPDTSFINEGATTRYNSDVLRITAYIAWALENTGYQGPAVDNAKRYVESHLAGAKPDAYTLAVLANFASDYGKDRAFTDRVLHLLLDAPTEEGDRVWWKAEETSVYASGDSAIVETTGLAAQALLKWGGDSAAATKAMNYIVAKKQASGTWGTTQATIMALRALLLAAEKGGSTAKGEVEVALNGETVQRLTLTAENNDLLHQFAFKLPETESAGSVEIRFQGQGSLAYQVAGRYFLPWTERPATEPISISVHYDRTRLAQDDIATATATVRNNMPRTANMVMVDLGIPPGFELLSEDLQAYRDKTAGHRSGRLEKFTTTTTQAILYFDSIAPGAEFKLPFRLRAKYPIRARTFASRVYEYYNPDVVALAGPVQIEIRKR
jgi:uncharacterized protein YfaS (alpha-2-macroglobulin family)